MSASNVVFYDFRQPRTETTLGKTTAALKVGDVTEAVGSPGSAQPQLRDMYPLAQESLLARAFVLLGEARELVGEADDHFRSGNFIGCDDALLRLRALLREVFLCRSVGMGFAQVVGGLNEGLRHLQPEAISELILRRLRTTIDAVRDRPGLSLDEAIALLLSLDDAGMNTDMPELGALAEIGHGE